MGLAASPLHARNDVGEGLPQWQLVCEVTIERVVNYAGKQHVFLCAVWKDLHYLMMKVRYT
jgi:hypothetical protein